MLRSLTLAAVLVCEAAAARAHAPLARAVLTTPEGGIALHMPGFGLVVRSDEAEPFAYACGALLALSPLAQTFAWALESSGSLLLGNEDGLVRTSATGCGSERVGTLPIAAIAVAADGTAYVLAGGSAPSVLAVEPSQELVEQSDLPEGGPVSALLADANDADRLYISRSSGAGTTLVLESGDRGVTFTTTEHEGELRLLDIRGDVRFALSKPPPPSEATLLLSRGGAAFAPVQSVRFFGGFAISPDGARVWIGDEAGGVFRSTDGGQSFENVRPELATACLAFENGALWACTPGLTTMPALAVSRDDGASFEDVLALADVDRMVQCPETVVAELCAQAWIEWQYDARLQPPDAGTPSSVPDAGTATEDGATAAPDAAQGSAVRPRRRADGCGASGRSSALAPGSLFAHAAVLALLLGRLRRTRRVF